MRKLVVVTFATLGTDNKYRDYSDKLQQLKNFVESREIEFKAFEPDEVSTSKHNKYTNNYFRLHKGAGYWHWKPIVILESMDLFPDSIILYVDVDVDLIRIEKDELVEKSNLAPIHAFITLDPIKKWTSKKCLKILDPQKIFRHINLFVATIILINPNFKTTRTFLLQWMKLMDNRKSLLDPIFFLGTRHRHDQSIFSLIAAKEAGVVKDLGPGFWGHGVNMKEIDFDKVWIATSVGKFDQKSEKMNGKDLILQFLSNLKCSMEILRFSLTDKNG